MKPITVKVETLRLTIASNRDRHSRIFEEAWIGYTKHIASQLQRMHDRIVAGKRVDLYELIQAPVPKDHTKDYDLALDMLKWHEEETYELSMDDFRAYVKDQWAWKDEFIGTASTYTRAARA